MVFKMNDTSRQDCLKDLQISKKRYDAIINVLESIGSFNKEVILYNEDSWNLYTVDKENRVFYFNISPFKTNYDNLDPDEVKLVVGNAITLYHLQNYTEIQVISSGIKSENSELIVGYSKYINAGRPNDWPKYIKYSFNDIEYAFYASHITMDIDIELIKAYLDKDQSFFNFFNILEGYMHEYNTFTVKKGKKETGTIIIDNGEIKTFDFTKEEKIDLENGKINKNISTVDDMTMEEIEEKANVLIKKYKKED